MTALKNLDVPFSNKVVEQKAAELVRRYASQRGWTPSLPVPVEAIIEHTLDLCLEYDVMDEPPGTTVWGCLRPAQRTITLNETHVPLFRQHPGLERFTLGHEAGHWVLHVDESDPSQVSLFGPPPEVIVCRDGDDRVREQVANKFSAFLLMPRDLMLRELPQHDLISYAGFQAFAAHAGVSHTALHLQLSKLRVPHLQYA